VLRLRIPFLWRLFQDLPVAQRAAGAAEKEAGGAKRSTAALQKKLDATTLVPSADVEASVRAAQEARQAAVQAAEDVAAVRAQAAATEQFAAQAEAALEEATKEYAKLLADRTVALPSEQHAATTRAATESAAAALPADVREGAQRTNDEMAALAITWLSTVHSTANPYALQLASLRAQVDAMTLAADKLQDVVPPLESAVDAHLAALQQRQRAAQRHQAAQAGLHDLLAAASAAEKAQADWTNTAAAAAADVATAATEHEQAMAMLQARHSSTDEQLRQQVMQRHAEAEDLASKLADAEKERDGLLIRAGEAGRLAQALAARANELGVPDVACAPGVPRAPLLDSGTGVGGGVARLASAPVSLVPQLPEQQAGGINVSDDRDGSGAGARRHGRTNGRSGGGASGTQQRAGRRGSNA
jgi:hypothetical protein